MKKALLVFGFAMCATMAFAQTKVAHRNVDVLAAQKPDINALMAEQPVDYKASIFTKDGVFDTVFTFDFADMTGIDTTGYVQQGDVIVFDGHDSVFSSTYQTVRVNNEAWCKWRHYSDSVDFRVRSASEYPISFSWMQENDFWNEYTDGAFMFFCYDYEQVATAGIVNSYFTLPAKTRTATNKMVHVALSQIYIKYYDQCFIDYMMPDGKWHSREINVSGVDCDVNSYANLNVRFVMPIELAAQNNIQLRIRAYSAKRGSAYGYLWFINNISIITDNRDASWEFNHSSTFDGFYGMIPQGMNIPLTYGLQVRNTNAVALNNAKIAITNAPANGSFTEVASSTPWNIPQGNVEKDYRLYINERGFLYNTSHDDDTNYSWGIYAYYDEQANYGRQENGYIGGFQGRGLNTQTPGQNFYRTIAQCDSASGTMTTVVRDSVLYTVSSNLQFDPDDPLSAGRVNGYRWARDNGIIPSNSSFHVGYNNRHFIDASDEEGHAQMAGYRVYVRYVTGNDIPEGYVFKGIEYIPSTALETDGMVDAPILPLMCESDGAGSWENVPCGIDNQIFTVSANDVSNLPSTYVLPSNQSNYSAVNVKFLDEPEVKKNTAYFIGYVLADNANFEVAAQASRYREGDSLKSYSSNADTRPYSRQNYPLSPFDMLVYDYEGYAETSTGGQNHWLMGWSINQFPMIRPIIGPADERVPVIVTADCGEPTMHEGDTTWYFVEHGSTNICGVDEDVAAGSIQSFDIAPYGDHTVLTDVYLNGTRLEPHDTDYEPEEGEDYVLYRYSYNVTNPSDDEDVLLYRDYYTLYFYGVPTRDGGHVITADYEWQQWTHSGIDPVAPEVRFNLAPNPATSTVKVKMAGVSGMANCSILDMSGRVVYNRDINTEAETTINVSNIPAGAYFVRITNNTFTKIEKLIIK